MLPYTRQHLEYGFATLLITGALWWATSRWPRISASLTKRWFAALIATGILMFVIAGFIVFVLGRDDSAAFAAISYAFYGGAYALPLCVLVSAIRARRVGAKIERLGPFLAGVSLAVGLHAQFVELDRLQLREERIESAPWSADVAPLVLVHISDLQTVGPCERNRRAVAMINSQNADLIIATGDYIAGPFDDVMPAIDEARAFLGALRAKHGVIVVAGHSDSERERSVIFAGLDLIYLRDEMRVIDCGEGRRVRIFGTTVEHPLLSAIGSPDPEAFTIVASHVPDLSTELDDRGVDLHLAGHTHGGQISIPFFGPPMTLSSLPRRYARGLHRFGDHWLNVCAGIGSEGNHAPRIRFNCPPEICRIEIAGGGDAERRRMIER